MKNKKGLIMGVANERSIAWGISKKLAEAGAELAFTYLGDALKKRVIPLAEKLNSKVTLSCDVEKKEEVIKLFDNSVFKVASVSVLETIGNFLASSSISLIFAEAAIKLFFIIIRQYIASWTDAAPSG